MTAAASVGNGAPTPVTPTSQNQPATLEGGSYDVIRRRLLEQVADLASKAEALNTRRKQIFGGTELALTANERIRTENNCIPRDMVSVGGLLLFGFQVFLGLKSETSVADVLSLYRFEKKDEGYELSAAPAEGIGAFLADAVFVKEFRDLFRYVKEARLLQLRRTETRLLVVVQVGASVRDVKVFRWAIDAQGRITYMDARGDEDAVPPAPHDFEWIVTGRDNHVAGIHPHVNILDEVFVETVGGDLTVKIENNTKVGVGIYREPVADANQTLDDGDISYAKLGGLILLRIKPFREEDYRYLVFNTRTKKVQRVDAIGAACHELPEDHGIVFPGGYMLQSGESKIFEGDVQDMQFERVVVSPNGEDVLYVYFRRRDGQYVLMPYNLIRKEIASLIRCSGHSLFPDGKMAIFRASGEEATRVHPIQVWQTPFMTAEFAASAPTDGSYLAKVGNADLVRGISDALGLRRLANADQPTRRTYEDLIAASTRVTDAYYWLGHAEAGDMATVVASIRQTSELIIDEFEKVIAIKKRADEALRDADAAQKALLASLHPESLARVEAFLGALTALRKQRGVLITLKDMRSIDLERVKMLEIEVVAHFDEVSRKCVEFLLGDDAFKPLVDKLEGLVTTIETIGKASDLQPFTEQLDTVQGGLTLLSEVVAGLKIDDTTARTRVLEGISVAFAQQNRARATLQGKKKDLSVREGRAEFAAQFKLLGQSVTSALALCDTPEQCDEQLSRLLLALEELEGRFGEFDEFLGDLASKRQDISDAIGARRQTLLDERQRRAQNLASAADRILAGVARRAKTFTTSDELNAYFAADPMIQKVGDLEAQLLLLHDPVRADEIKSRLLSARQDALRSLRDKTDLFEEGSNVIKLGVHRFTVSTQPLELTLVPRDGAMALHLTGTDFFEIVEDAALVQAKDLWDQTIISENTRVYRGEYLAASMLLDAEDGKSGLSIEVLSRAIIGASADASSGPASSSAPKSRGGLLERVRAYAENRLDEGYERGVHDADAALILGKLLTLRTGAGLLRFAPDARADACLFWAELDGERRDRMHRRAQSVARLRTQFGYASEQSAIAAELESEIQAFLTERRIPTRPGEVRVAARYLVEELADERVRFITSADARMLKDAFVSALEERNARRSFEEDLRALEAHPAERIRLATAWIEGFVAQAPEMDALRFVREAAGILVTERRIDRQPSTAPTRVIIEGLLGQHARTEGRTMELVLDEFLERVGGFIGENAPRFRAYRGLRAAILDREKRRLRLNEFAPRVITSFVRNRLIDEVYLPLVGANLAKQIGAAGDKKRTDLMGLLLLVSPPGYGKTTLMEYVANRLGLVFMKVNGPALGHEVTSLDPKEAPNATARQEVEKINLALEMGNNVMLYLDDIQHTNPELLQKFISLCDAQRRIEGVYGGRTRTYDLRGKKFCIAMAGNPYTESGTRFQIPDMLANRADTYNLGDILDGKGDLFALSYLENALTSNAVLAPLAGRDPADVHKLIRIAGGEQIALTEIAHGYSAAEAQEITELLRRMLTIQKVLLKVNLEYIASASQDDAFRTEPNFKLQGSYRNMNKLAEKVVSAMNDVELERLIDDHYTSESQTLTTGAEQNLLKLAELRGRMSPEDARRWSEIKETYVRGKRMGGKDGDPVARLTGTLGLLDVQLQGIREALIKGVENGGAERWLAPHIEMLGKSLAALGRPRLEIALDQPNAPGVAEVLTQQLGLLERMLVPLVQSRHDGDGAGHEAIEARLSEISALIKKLDGSMRHGSSAPSRFDVPLDHQSGHNFYRGVAGDDVILHGGVFVSTYAKLPPLGAAVALDLSFPGGARSEITGTVSFTQDIARDDGSALQAGFGVRIEAISDECRDLVGEFVRMREPLLRDA